MDKHKQWTRREAVAGAIAAAGAITILPSRALGRAGFLSPNDKANIAFIGIGNFGGAALNELSTQNIVALCDVDWRTPEQLGGRPNNDIASMRVKKYPQAKVFDDFRIMLDEMDKQIDAVVVSTADHTHALASILAINRGKHTFCEKPLAHDVAEVRAMMAAASRHPHLNTQTGTQGHASEDVRNIVEWVQDGAIGTVKEVHVFQASQRPRASTPSSTGSPQAGPQGAPRGDRMSPYAQIAHVNDVVPVPPEVKWDLWVGPAPMRNYNPMYLPLRWRNWLDFGTGILGDHGPHFIDPVFWALDMGFPDSIEAVTDPEYDPAANAQTFPRMSRVEYKFPAKDRRPAFTMTWFSGDPPPLPPGWDAAVDFPDGGGVIYGTKGSIVYGPVYSSPVSTSKQVWLLPKELDMSYKRPAKTLPRGTTNWMEWIEAAKAGKQSSATWAYGGPLTQICLLGDIAIRNKGVLLEYDAKKGRFKNSEAANAMLSRKARTGWALPG